MPLRLHLPTGLNLLFTLENLIVHPVVPLRLKQSRFGSTVEHLFGPKIVSVNGKSFISVIAVQSGGHGVAIDLPLI